MVFDHEHRAKTAGSIQPGDLLLLPSGGWTKVLSIRNVTSTGLFAPFTPSGKLVVNGIVASSYIDVEWPLVSGQWVAHTFDMPHRVICSHFLDWCKGETYAPNGVSNWLDVPRRLGSWAMGQNSVLQGFAFVVAVFVLSLLAMAQVFYAHGFIVLVALAAAWRICTTSRLVLVRAHQFSKKMG